MFVPRKIVIYLATLVLLVLVLGMGLPVSAAAPGDVVINEIIQNPAAVGDNVGEWFELYNATGSDIDIDGWTIRDDGIDSHVIINGGPLVIPAGGYLVLGNNTDTGSNGGVTVDYSYGTDWFLANADDEVVLLDASLVEIDRVNYDGGPLFPDPTGASMALISPNLDNNVGANWCTAATQYGAGDLGTPGAANDCPPPPEPVLVINEIDYDQPLTDAAEYVEIMNVGPSSANLDNVTLELVNGTGGGAAIYNTIDLPNVDLASGDYYVVCANSATVPNCDLDSSPDTNFIQNGAPDGVGLKYNGNLIDAVSYEGDTGAPYTEGSGSGLEDTAAGDDSISRCPDGADTNQNNVDLIYTSSSPGAVNVCPVTAEPVLVINEIDYDQPGTDAAEYVEIKNVGSDPANLDNVTLELVNGTGGGAAIYNTIDLPNVVLAPNDYYVVCANSATVPNCDLDSSPDTNFIQNGAPDGVGLRYNGNLLDAVSYEGDTGAPYTEGSGSGLEDTAAGGDSISRCPDGIDTNQNNVDLVYAGSTPGAGNDCGGLVINEIIQNPAAVADSAGEWFELYNPTGAAIDINGWTIADNDFDSHLIANGGPLLVPAGGYLVLGINSDSGTNGGVTVAYQYSNFFLGNGFDEVVLFDLGMVEIDRVEYDDGATFPDPNGASMSLSDPTLDNNVGANWCESVTPFGSGDFGTPGAENVCVIVPPPLSCDDNSVITLIHDIQGAGLNSPIAGSTVVIDGVVVGDFQNNASADSGELNGFYVQEEDADADGNTLTSEGIFVFAPGADDVSVGDHVRVRGDVSEFSTSNGASLMTELGNATVAVCTTPAAAPAATAVTFPLTAVTDMERYEGMLVTFPQALNISEYFNFDRFNEVVLTLGRQYQGTAVAEPGAPANAVAAQNALERITLDDGRSNQNPDPAIHPNGSVFDLTNLFRGGDTVQDTTGVIDNTFGLYRIQPTQAPSVYSAENPRQTTPPDVGGSLTVASFNVLNYFSTIDNGTPICGPASNQDCRGADSANEFTRQRTKIIAALADINADVFGLIELENHAADAALIDLVTGLNNLVGAGTYSYIATGPIGTDAIKVALIYKSATVTPLGDYEILDSSVDPRFRDNLNRPVLAQTFIQNSNGAVVTVAVNHLKSKGSNCNDVGDPDNNDGQGNCNQTRLLAAQALVDWLATDPTGSGDPDFLIIGDLNSYDKEDPIDAILAGADDLAGTSDDYTDLNGLFNGELAYSYVFDGQLGYLDHALSNYTLTSQVTGVADWHINADEPDILDYNTDFKLLPQQALYEPNAFRSSDHDPVIVGLDLNAPPVCGTAVPSIATIWPPNHKFVEVSVLGVTDPDGDPFTITITAIMQDEAVNAPDSGNTYPDGMGVGTSTAFVRAERVGDGNGRVYHIYFTATDIHGNSCNGVVQVGVPMDIDLGPAVDDGPLYDSTADLP